MGGQAKTHCRLSRPKHLVAGARLRRRVFLADVHSQTWASLVTVCKKLAACAHRLSLGLHVSFSAESGCQGCMFDAHYTRDQLRVHATNDHTDGSKESKIEGGERRQKICPAEHASMSCSRLTMVPNQSIHYPEKCTDSVTHIKTCCTTNAIPHDANKTAGSLPPSHPPSLVPIDRSVDTVLYIYCKR